MSKRYGDEPTYTPYWHIEDGEVKRISGGVQKVALCDGTGRMAYILMGVQYSEEYVSAHWFDSEEKAIAALG